MSILLSLALLMSAAPVAQAVAPVPPAAPDAAAVNEEVVVIGQKFRNWKVSLKTHKGVPQCTVKVSSGDPELDKIGCDALTICMAEIRAQHDNKAERRVSGDERREKRVSVNQQLSSCFKEHRDTAFAELAARRAKG